MCVILGTKLILLGPNTERSAAPSGIGVSTPGGVDGCGLFGVGDGDGGEVDEGANKKSS